MNDTPDAAIDTIRDIVAGPQLGELQAQVTALSGEVAVLRQENRQQQENYQRSLAIVERYFDHRFNKHVRRTAKRRAALKARVKNLEKQVQQHSEALAAG